jgi:hypothetical protein
MGLDGFLDIVVSQFIIKETLQEIVYSYQTHRLKLSE